MVYKAYFEAFPGLDNYFKKQRSNKMKEYMMNMMTLVMKYWDNKKSLKKTFKDGRVIGATFRDIRYAELLADDEFKAYLDSAEQNGISVNHRKAGDRF